MKIFKFLDPEISTTILKFRCPNKPPTPENTTSKQKKKLSEDELVEWEARLVRKEAELKEREAHLSRREKTLDDGENDEEMAEV